MRKRKTTPLPYYWLWLPCLLVTVLWLPKAYTQIPVGAVMDTELLAANTTNSVVEGTMNFLLKNERPLQERIKNVQDFFRKANTIVNGAIKNMRMVKQTVELEKDIVELYQRSIEVLNTPNEQTDFIDKWKHAQILLALTREATSVFELFQNLIQDDALTVNDKGRIVLLEKTYKDLRMIKSAMRLQLRRINKEIYQYRQLKREVEIFEHFFSAS